MVTCVGKDTDGYGARVGLAVTNNTDVDMMFGDVDAYAYVNGVVRDVRMRKPVAAGEENDRYAHLCRHLRRSRL